MKRRTLLRTLTATGAATMVGGPAAAAGPPGRSDPVADLDVTVDVSSVSGTVSLEQLLDDDALDRLPADVDPAERTVSVAPEAESITLSDCCILCERTVCACLCCQFVDCGGW